MNGIIVGRRVLDALLAREIAAGQKILPGTGGAAIFERRRQRRLTAAIDADAAAIVERAGARGDVDNAGGAQSILRRQRPVEQSEIADKACLDHLAETGDAGRQKDAIDAVLHVFVLVADVERAARDGILRYA